jgi:signal transduction histidine kinase
MAAARTDQQARDPIITTLFRTGLVVVYLVSLAQFVRALAMVDDRGAWLWYLGLGAAYLLLLTLVVLRPFSRRWLVHAVLGVQCLIVLALLDVDPEFDFMAALFVPVAFEAALLLTGRAIWCWVTGLAALTAGSLMLYLGPLRGLSLATLSIVAAAVVAAALVVVAREIEASRRQSQATLEELQVTHARLRAYAVEAGELAVAAERDRVARDLNESVARAVAAIIEDVGGVRALLAARPDEGGQAAADEAMSRLAALQAATQQALAQMRRLLAELRPAGDGRGSPPAAT